MKRILFWVWPLLAVLGLRGASVDFQVAGETVTLESRSATEVQVFWRGMRLNRATGLWNVDLVVRNVGAQSWTGPLVVRLEAFTETAGPGNATGTDSGGRPYIDLTARLTDNQLAAGAETRSVVVTFAGSTRTPTLTGAAYSGPAVASPAAFVRTVDGAGIPLAGVTVTETGPTGSRSRPTGKRAGAVTLGQGAGSHVWKFTKEGHLPVWRQATLAGSGVTGIAGPWLAVREGVAGSIGADGGQVATADGAVTVSFPAGAWATTEAVRVTVLNGQTLPGFLPAGWSPVQAFWVEADRSPAVAGTVVVVPGAALGADARLAWVRWDESALVWRVVSVPTGAGTAAMTFGIPSLGAYALVVADAGGAAPASPTEGAGLPAAVATEASTPATTATASVSPESAAASTLASDVAAMARVEFRSTGGALASGTVLECTVTESYLLMDGTTRVTPSYALSVVGYGWGTGTEGVLAAAFPMRPLLLLPGETLDRATISVSVRAPVAFAGTLLAGGLGVVTADGYSLTAGAGDFAGDAAVLLAAREVASLETMAGEGVTPVAAFEVVTEDLEAGGRLDVAGPALDPDGWFVLGRVTFTAFEIGFEPVERYRSDSGGLLQRIEPVDGSGLAGVDGAGLYVLMAVPSGQALVHGVARDRTGDLAEGMTLRLGPWTTFSDAAGAWKLVAGVGSGSVEVQDPETGDTTATGVAVGADLASVEVSVASAPAAPQVSGVSPADGSTGVARVTPVEVTFTKAVNPGTIALDGVRLLDALGETVAASLSLNLAGTVATLLPTSPLGGDATYQIEVAATVADADGRPLEGERQFWFTTETDVLTRSEATLVIYEPVDGRAGMSGGSGLAEPESPVILVNETTGYTATVLSRIDGSFSNSVPAGVDDTLLAVIVNRNGTRTVVNTARQVFQDGTIGLFSGGGLVEAEGPHGNLEIEVDAGTVRGRALFQATVVGTNEVAELVSTNAPAEGQVLGAFRLGASGDLASSPHVRFPFDTNALPSGVDPAEATFALAAYHEVDGVMVYEVIDRMSFEDGKLVTHSPPFVGLLLSFSSVGAVFGDLLMAPLYLAAGNSMTVAGRVLSGEYDTGGRLQSSTLVPVPGATVSVYPNGTVGGLPGRLTPGSVTVVARGTNAAFSFVVPGSQASTLVARSPRFPGVLATHAVSPASLEERVATYGIASGQDVIFSRARTQTGPDWTKPDLVFSHTPYIAAVGSNITVRVTAVDDRSAPVIEVEVESVESLAGGVTVSDSDATIVDTTSEAVGATTSRNTVEVSCVRAAVVTLRATAIDGSGNRKQANYTVVFGGEALTGTDPLESPDPRDGTGPRVESTVPTLGQRALVPGQSLVLRFSEAISDSVFSDIYALRLSPDAGLPSLSLSADQTELTVTYPELDSGTDYTLVVNGGVTDLRGNRLDQDPATGGEQAFELAFSTARIPSNPLEAAGNTAGSVLRGNHLYTLERGGAQPYSLVVYELSNQGQATEVARLRMPGYPRDLVLIPNFGFQRRPDTAAETRDLLAIVGGDIHGSADSANHYLRIVDISDPANPTRVASTTVSFAGSSAVTRVRWSPPYVGFLEIGGAYSVSLVHLQNFIYGLNLTTAEFEALPRDGEAGVDLNGDGDYVDAGEQIPLPPRGSNDFVGRDAQFAMSDTDQPIRDFVIEGGGAFVGVVTGSGNLLGADGLASGTNAPPSYRTLYWNGVDLPREVSSYVPTNHYLTRVTSLFGQAVIRSNQVEELDLVLLSVVADDRTSQRITVLDVSDPTLPTVLTEVALPVETGVPVFSVVARDDGMLVAGTGGDAWLIDPRRLLEADVSGGQALHPALVGRVGSGGTSAYTFGALRSGWLSSVNGSRNRVLFTGPQFEFVSFPGVTPFAPTSLDGWTDAQLAERLAAAESTTFLMPTRFEAVDGVVESGVTPPDPATHYHVLVHAPGVVGEELSLALQTLDGAGRPVAPKGFLFPAVHAISATTQSALEQEPEATDAPVRVAKAWRLSDNPASPYYNLYLSRPIALLYEEVTPAALAAADAVLERELLWSGHQLRVTLDPELAAGGLLSDFGSAVSTARHEYDPGTEAIALSFPADYLMGPNPPPANGGFEYPGTLDLVGGHNGELQHTSTDMTLPGRRMALEFRRTSNGQALYDGPFGRGWDFNFNQRVRPLREEVFAAGMKLPLVVRASEADSEIGEAGDLLFYNGAGRTLLFRDAGETAPEGIVGDELAGPSGLDWLARADRFYLPPVGVFEYFVHFPSGEFARLTRDGMQYWYGPSGRLERVYDRYPENQFELVYNANGELVQILDELGRALDIGRYRRETDRNRRLGIDDTTTEAAVVGRIARLVDYSGRDVRYSYDGAGLLIRMEGPEVGPSHENTFTGRQQTHYSYSGTDDAATTGRTLQAVTSGDEGGTPIFSVAGYADRGRDAVGQLRLSTGTVSIAQGYANTSRALSAGGALAAMTGADGAGSEYTLDAAGRPTQARLSGGGASDETTVTEYEDNGLIRRITFPEGNSIEYTYDSANPSLRSRANVTGIRRVAGARGGEDLVATSTFDSWYNIPAGDVTSESGVTTTVTLRSDHRDPASRIRAGELETFIHNDHGQLEAHTASDGITRTFVYDATTGFLVSKTVGGLATTFEYGGAAGSRGLVTSQVDTRGVVTTFEHDARNQLVTTTTGTAVTKHSYDENGYCVRTSQTVDDGREFVEERTFNQFGFMTEQRVRSVEVNGEVNDLVTLYEPDEVHRVKVVIQPTGIRHEMTYDHAGRLTRLSVPDAGYEEVYTYDLNGNLKTTQVGASTEEKFYDGHDRMIAVRDARGSVRALTLNASGHAVVETVSDSAGELLSAVSREYDAHDRCTAVTVSSSSGTSTTTYAYNPTERTMTVTDAKGAVATVAYDAAGRVAREETPNRVVVSTHDGGGNVTQRTITDGSMTFTETHTYNELGHLVRTADSLGQETVMEVGEDGRLKAVTDRESHRRTTEHTLLGEPSAELSAAGVLKFMEYGLTRDTSAIADAASQTQVYEHDTDGRLVSETSPAGDTTGYSGFNAFRQATRATYPGGVTVESTYDVAGQMTRRTLTGPGGVHTEDYAYDGLGRLSEVSDPSGVHSREHDLLGFIQMFHFEYDSAGLTFDVLQSADASGFRESVTYPAGPLAVAVGRDISGRLLSLTPATGEPAIAETTYVTDTRMVTRVLGANRVRFEAEHDALRRNTAWRYRRLSDGAVLVDVRSAYDRNGAPQARQAIHAAGRTDLFQFDGDQRLIRADIGARPSLGSGESGREFAGFSTPSRVTGDWVAGFFARSYAYTPLNAFGGASLSNPDGLTVPVFAEVHADADELGHAQVIDGFARTRDAGGNVTSTRLAVRVPGASAPEWVEATLAYNDLGQLVRVTRADGVVVSNEYGTLGLRIRRTISGPADRCDASDRVYIYDGGNLIEERDGADSNRLVARYYYGDEGDELVAGDVDDGSGALVRRYFLTDPLRSVVAVTDDVGTVVERVAYDAWGEPTLHGPDASGPAVHRVVRTEDGFVVTFTERVLPVFAGTPATSGLVTAYASLGEVLSLHDAGGAVSGTVTLEESFAGAAFGTSLRFRAGSALSGAAEIRVAAGKLQDEAGGTNASQAVSIDLGAAVGSELFAGAAAGSTAPVLRNRSAVGNGFLFHGQLFEPETGLLYCRARFYQPATGLFLQRDPAGYAAGVNQYAAFAWNPVALRDTSGAYPDFNAIGTELRQVASQASYSEDGLDGVLTAAAVDMAGRVLQLGTDTAIGMNLLENPGTGLGGLRNLSKGADLVAGDLTVAAGVLALSPLGMAAGRRVEGYLSRPKAVPPSWQTVMRQRGFTAMESRAITEVMRAQRVTAISVRSWGRKAAMRQMNVRFGVQQKPSWVEKKTGPNAIVEIVEPDPSNWITGQRVQHFVSDADLLHVEINGRLATESQVQRFYKRANERYAELWREAGRSGPPNPPFQHSAHLNMGDVLEARWTSKRSMTQGKIYRLGHPGESVGIRITGSGNIVAFDSPKWWIQKRIDASEKVLKRNQQRLGLPYDGYPSSVNPQKSWQQWWYHRYDPRQFLGLPNE